MNNISNVFMQKETGTYGTNDATPGFDPSPLHTQVYIGTDVLSNLQIIKEFMDNNIGPAVVLSYETSLLLVLKQLEAQYPKGQVPISLTTLIRDLGDPGAPGAPVPTEDQMDRLIEDVQNYSEEKSFPPMPRSTLETVKSYMDSKALHADRPITHVDVGAMLAYAPILVDNLRPATPALSGALRTLISNATTYLVTVPIPVHMTFNKDALNTVKACR